MFIFWITMEMKTLPPSFPTIPLVCLVCCNKTPQTGWLANNRNLFLTIWEGRKSEIKVLSVSVSGERQLPGSEKAVFSPCPHMVKRAENL